MRTIRIFNRELSFLKMKNVRIGKAIDFFIFYILKVAKTLFIVSPQF